MSDPTSGRALRSPTSDAIRVLAQVNELQKICDRLCEAEDPPNASVALRVRIVALRQSFLAATETPAVAESAPPPSPHMRSPHRGRPSCPKLRHRRRVPRPASPIGWRRLRRARHPPEKFSNGKNKSCAEHLDPAIWRSSTPGDSEGRAKIED